MPGAHLSPQSASAPINPMYQLQRILGKASHSVSTVTSSTKKKKNTKECNYNNQNYNKILECDWLSVALIIAFIGQFTRHSWCYWTVYASCLVLLDSIRVICARCYIDCLVHFLLQKVSTVTFSFMKTFN